MSWTHDDPGQGSPAGIQGVAALRTARASKVRDAQRTLTTASSQSGVDWEASSQKSFAAELSKNAADVELVATGLEKQAAALITYAGQLAQLKDRQVTLEAKRASAEQSLANARAKMPFPNLIPSTSSPLFEKTPAHDEADREFERQKAKAQGLVDDANSKLRGIETEWDQLVADRRQIDATCASALQNGDVLGSVVAFTGASIAAASPDALLDRLRGLSQTDLTILLAQHPELADRMNAATPEHVAAWWNGMGDAEQAAFVAGIPSIIGSLNGVAALDRVAANRLNAAERLAALQKTAKDWKERLKEPYQTSIHRSDLDALEKEIDYLKKAVSEPPTVQLYLYDKDNDRIIEMVGTPSDKTKTVVTYVPGTFSNMDQFYSRDTPEIADYLVQGSRGTTVAFVYKDGTFPTSLPQANSKEFARDAGAKLADFETGMRFDPLLESAQQVGIGHSWGTANVTSAEVYGVHWNQAVSLSGAGMLPEWRPSPGTTYTDLSYNDILQFGQGTGLVWDTKNPRSLSETGEPWFNHSQYYAKPEKYDGPLASHNLVAENVPENQEVLLELKELVRAGER